MATFWIENVTNKNGRLFKHQMNRAVSTMWVIILVFCACNLTADASGRWGDDLVPIEHYSEQTFVSNSTHKRIHPRAVQIRFHWQTAQRVNKT